MRNISSPGGAYMYVAGAMKPAGFKLPNLLETYSKELPGALKFEQLSKYDKKIVLEFQNPPKTLSPRY